jgi:hypothetical protein
MKRKAESPFITIWIFIFTTFLFRLRSQPLQPHKSRVVCQTISVRFSRSRRSLATEEGAGVALVYRFTRENHVNIPFDCA